MTPSTTFPSRCPDVRQYVLEFVQAAVVEGLADGAPLVSFYADRARSVSEQKAIGVSGDWPAYPGEVPAIGVARGPQPDGAQTLGAGVFAGDVVELDESGAPTGSATYFAHPMTAEIVVELLHDERAERDRLHDELLRALAPLARALQERDALIHEVEVTARKRELEPGAPTSVLPETAYASLFTVRVRHELLEARDVGDADSVTTRVQVSVTVTESTP